MAQIKEWILCTGICILLLVTLADGKSVQIHTTGKASRVSNHRPTIPNYKRIAGRKGQVVATKPATKIKSNTQIKRQDGVSTSIDPLQSTFNSGLQRFFGFLRNTFISRPEGSSGITNEETGFRLPGLPTTSPFHNFDTTSIIKLIENTDDSQLGDLAESALVDTVSQLVGIIGFDDLRDWLGIILMYFVLGPIMVPLYWLPISLFGMAGLMAPLFFFNPPSKLNTNVMGHDPIKPEAEAEEGAERSLKYLSESDSIFNLFSNKVNERAREANGTSSTVKVLEGCVDRLGCHLTRAYRDNPVSQWLTSHLNTTKVEWARMITDSDDNFTTSPFEDCTKYTCSIFPAVRTFMSAWNGSNNDQ
ncbi:hypothetical protein Ocin01_01787 [Orchesella cincta]|uniref:Uncharacterized protein n=1 Tax=Orchesella cincta TaxID=48709 RepID=A0A1D2NHZ4_ORCCI|nr:hypothetical protein Ocin01_01787 [Orchesella cincta]